jgi:ribosomal protein L17
MTKAHKEAIAAGRSDASAVRHYLEALSQRSNGNGNGTRRRSKAQLCAELATVTRKLGSEADVLERVVLLQRQVDLEKAISATGSAPAQDMAALEKDFKKAARRFSERRGISYSAWRMAGVPAAVLTAAKIPRTRIEKPHQ